MSKTFREWNPEQTLMFPPTPMDWVSKDDVVLFIRNLILEELDLSEIEDQYQEERGYPPFHPVMMTGLVLYSYCQGIYSSRRIARACKQRGRFSGAHGYAKTGPPNGESVPETTSEGVESIVSASAAVV